MSHAASVADLTRPATEADVRRVYVDAAPMGYLLNAVGAVTAFIATALALTDTQAALHSVALAGGLVAAGLLTDRLDRMIGTARMHIAALVGLGLSASMLALAPALAVTLGSAAGVGLSFGVLLAHVNQTVTAGGGSLARMRVARGTLTAQISSLTVPIVISVGVTVGVGWGLFVVPGLVMIALSLVLTRGRNYRPLPPRVGGGSLPRAYWLAWLLLVTSTTLEFAIVFWSGTLVEGLTGVPLEEATLVVSAMLSGMVVARLGLSVPVISARDPILLVRFGLLVLVASVLAAWASTSFALSLAWFFLAGLGLGVQFPLAVGLVMATAPLLPQLASSRLVLASGLGVLAAPMVLGVIADATDMTVAWLVVPAICLATLAITFPVARGRATQGA